MGTGNRLPDFDALVALHRQDPEAFEAFRRHALREAVDLAPATQRPALERLLAKIEAARNSAATPLDAAITASRMMHESVVRLGDAWGRAQHAVAGLQATLLLERLRTGNA